MDSDSDNEVFFGRITEKEDKIAKSIRKRRTELFRTSVPSSQLQSSVLGDDEQEGGNDNKATLLDYTQDLTSKLSLETSGSLFMNEGSSSQLFHCSLESELDQEPLFVFTPSHKEVKRNSEFHGQSIEDNLYGIQVFNRNKSQDPRTFQSLAASVSDVLELDSLHSSTDSTHPTNSYCEISAEKPRVFSNESNVSEESVDCSSHSLEIQRLDHSEHCTQVDRYDEETVEFLVTSESEKEASADDEKVLFAIQMDAEKIEPGITVDRGNNVGDTIVSEDNVPETSVCGGYSVPGNTGDRRDSVLDATGIRGKCMTGTTVSGGDNMKETSVSVPETEVSRGDCIPEMPLIEQDSKLKMEVSGGDIATESNIRGNIVLKSTVSEGCIVSDMEGNGGDILSESVLSQEESLANFERSDMKGFQEPHRKELIHKTESDGENISEALPSLISMMNERLSIDPIGDSCTDETGMIFDNELKNLSRIQQSYYSSLDVISINSSNVYGDFLIEEDLLDVVNCELPCCYESNLKSCTYISRTSKNFGDFPKQEENLGQITENKVSLSMNPSESDASVSTSEEHKLLESQDYDIHYHKSYNEWNQKCSIESAYISDNTDKQNTESFKIDDSLSLIHSQINKNNEDNFSTCEKTCSVSSIFEYNNMKLINQNIPMPKSPVLATAHVDCLEVCDTVTSPLTSSTQLSITSAEVENLHCSLLATPSISSSQSPFSQNEIGVTSDSNDVENRGSGNRALLVPQMKESMSSCTLPQDHQMSGSSEVLKGRIPVYETLHQLIPCTPQKSCDTSIDSEHGMQSPSEKFNDTIEEMEMMLKYGIDYGERAEENISKLDSNVNKSYDDELGNSNDQIYGDKANNPIPNPVQKTSVASMISNFHPALESSCFSSHQEDLSYQRKGSKDIETMAHKDEYNPSQSDSRPKREPPLKPPRNVYSSNVSPKKCNSFKVSTLSTPKYLAVRSKGVVEQGYVQKNVISKEGLSASKAASSQVSSKKAKRLAPKQPSVLKSSEWTPGSQPQTNVSGLGCMGTPKNPQSTLRFQHQSPGIKQRTPTLPKSPGAMNVKLVAKSGLPPRPTPSKLGKTVLKQASSQTTKLHTPKERINTAQTKVNFVSKTPSPTVKHNRQHLIQGLNIVSPVAKYLKENPPPPLVVTVKPRHKISPKKIQAESSPTKTSHCMATSQTSHQAGAGKPAHYIQLQVSPKIPINHKPEKDVISNDRGETALSKIQDDLERLTLKMKGVQNYVKEEEHNEPVHISKEDHILPVTKYSSVPAIVVDEENKENKRGCRCREIPSNKQPPIVVKHKGRMKMRKVTFQEGFVDNASPKRNRSPSPVDHVTSSQRSCPSVRGSLMEVSLYESHEMKYTNTLH